MRVYTSSKPKKPRKKKHHSAHDTSAQSLIAQNQKLAVELDDLSHKYEKAKRHERDLRDLREGIEVLESGLRSRSEESMACLGKVDCALQAIEDRVLGSTEAGEGGEHLRVTRSGYWSQSSHKSQVSVRDYFSCTIQSKHISFRVVRVFRGR